MTCWSFGAGGGPGRPPPVRAPAPRAPRPSRGLAALAAASAPLAVAAAAAALPDGGPKWFPHSAPFASVSSPSPGVDSSGSPFPFPFPFTFPLTFPGLSGPWGPAGATSSDVSSGASGNASGTTIWELLGPAALQAGAQWLAHAGPALQRRYEAHMAELASSGCPATVALLRSYVYGAAVQVLTLGFATRFLLLDRAAVCRGQLWRLVAHSLVHAGPLHLAANYAMLSQLGPPVESLCGSDRFAALYAASAAAATIASLALNGGRPSLGASGALFGLAAAEARYHAAHRGYLPAEAEAALRGKAERAAVAAAAYHLLLWGRLDVSAHMGGLLAGWAAAELLGPDFRLERPGGSGLWGWLRGSHGHGGGADDRDSRSGGRGPVRGGPGVVFRDRPKVAVYADPAPRLSIPFPLIGPGYSVAAATVGLEAGPGPGRGHSRAPPPAR